MSNKYVGAAQFFKNLVFGKPKVYPTIKSVKPNLTKTVKQSKSDEFSKRINLLNKAESKLKTGKEMMKEAQKARKNLVDTGRAFQFKSSKDVFAVRPGEKPEKFYKGLLKEDKPKKKFKTGKQLEAEKKARENKKGGGMMGRRFGMKSGTPFKKETDVEKIKKAFSPKGKNLKPVDPKKQKGLSKLPREVRNKMGYMKSGGRA